MIILRKILEVSSVKKNHNGIRKVPVEKSWRKKLKTLRVRLSQMVASLKEKDYRRLVFNTNPKDKEGRKVADFAICCKREEIVRFRLNRKSLTVSIVWMVGKENLLEVHSFNEFLEELTLLKRKLAILLK